jgi:hypothetical protein
VQRECLYDETKTDTFSESGKKKLKVVQCGLKVFDRDLQQVRPTRLLQEGLHIVLPFMTKRLIKCSPPEFMQLLCAEQDLDMRELNPAIQAALTPLELGSVAVVLQDDASMVASNSLARGGQKQLMFVIWRGRAKMNAMVQKEDRMALLSLLWQRHGIRPAVPTASEAIADDGDAGEGGAAGDTAE